jgi:hypothetical protein
MRKVSHELRYDGATPEQVYAMLGDPAFREAVCEYQRYHRHDITITPEGNGMAVVVDQHRPADGVPAIAQKFVGAEINVHQVEHWSSPTDASLEVAIPGKPGHMKGTVHLEGDAAGTTETVAVDVTVSIPLLGGKIEGAIGDMLLKALRAENTVGRKWLAGERP